MKQIKIKIKKTKREKQIIEPDPQGLQYGDETNS